MRRDVRLPRLFEPLTSIRDFGRDEEDDQVEQGRDRVEHENEQEALGVGLRRQALKEQVLLVQEVLLLQKYAVEERTDQHDDNERGHAKDKQGDVAARHTDASLLNDAAADVEHVTEPEGGGRVQHEDVVQVVDLLQEVVRQGKRDFECCQHKNPDLHLVARLVGPDVPFDVSRNANIKKQSLRRQDHCEDPKRDFLACFQFFPLRRRKGSRCAHLVPFSNEPL